jgi:hypothetical protein
MVPHPLTPIVVTLGPVLLRQLCLMYRLGLIRIGILVLLTTQQILEIGGCRKAVIKDGHRSDING